MVHFRVYLIQFGLQFCLYFFYYGSLFVKEIIIIKPRVIEEVRGHVLLRSFVFEGEIYEFWSIF